MFLNVSHLGDMNLGQAAMAILKLFMFPILGGEEENW